MPELWLAFGAIAGGCAGLVWSADRFVDGSAAIANSLGVAPLIVGLTIVSLGTSAPEIIIAISASLRDAGELAIGNAVGSNLANIGLVLGVTALIARLPVQKHILRHELPILTLVTLLGGVFLFDGLLARWEGIVLVVLLGPTLAYLVWAKTREMTPQEIVEEQSKVVPMARTRALGWFVVGLVLLIASSEVLVWGAKTAALAFGVSPLVIGLTLVAVGTSLPELAASVISARRGIHGIALGNIIGSNIFNLMAVMALPGILRPPRVEPSAFSRDYLAMAALTALLMGGAYLTYLLAGQKRAAGLGRGIAVVLLTAYAGYYVLLYHSY